MFAASTAQSNKVVLITGAASGIGAATARRFIAEGWSVALNYLDDAQRAAAEVICGSAMLPGQKAIALRGDVSKDEDCRALVSGAVDGLGRLDGLVNAAGISKMVPLADFEGLSPEDFLRIYAVNTVGPFLMMRAAARALKASGNGAIVNISSRAAFTGTGSSIAYAASKGALNTLTLSFARQLAPEVRVNAICPALTEEGFVERLAPESFAQRREEQIARSPLHKIGKPGEVAETIYWLIASAPMMTGECLRLDFGLHLNG